MISGVSILLGEAWQQASACDWRTSGCRETCRSGGSSGQQWELCGECAQVCLHACAPLYVLSSKDILLVCNTDRTRIQPFAFVQTLGQLFLLALLNLVRKVIFIIDFPRTNWAMSLITSAPLNSLRSEGNDKVNSVTCLNSPVF